MQLCAGTQCRGDKPIRPQANWPEGGKSHKLCHWWSNSVATNMVPNGPAETSPMAPCSFLINCKERPGKDLNHLWQPVYTCEL